PLSNLDKVLYPKSGFTKGQVIDYYIRIAPVLLPHLKNRAPFVIIGSANSAAISPMHKNSTGRKMRRGRNCGNYLRRRNFHIAARPSPASASVEGSGTVVMFKPQLTSVLWLPLERSARKSVQSPSALVL